MSGITDAGHCEEMNVLRNKWKAGVCNLGALGCVVGLTYIG